MPVGLMKLPTATPARLEEFRDDPKAFEAFVRRAVEAAGGRLEELFFDPAKERAYALVKDLDEYVDVKAVARILGAKGFKRMITVEQAVQAVARDRELRERLGGSS